MKQIKIKPFQLVVPGKYKSIADPLLTLERWQVGGNTYWDFFYDGNTFDETYDTMKEALERFEKYGLEEIKQRCLKGLPSAKEYWTKKFEDDSNKKGSG